MVADGIVMKGPARLLLSAAIAAALFCGLAAALETDRLASIDEAIRMDLHGLAAPLLTSLALSVTWLGSVGVLVSFWAIAIVALVKVRRRDGAVFLTVMMVGALALNNSLKFWFERERPSPFFGSEPVTYSFPSGHALFSLCFYGGLAIAVSRSTQSAAMKAVIWAMTALLVLAIGGTRIYLGVHYPSDVLGGYLVAIAWIGVVLATERRVA